MGRLSDGSAGQGLEDVGSVRCGGGFVVSGRDGSSVGLAERGAERVARVYATLSMAYEAIVRIRQRLPLFEEVCRVLVERGQLRMAWVGEVDDHGWIVPVAHAGATDGYLDELRISVRDVPEGRGPTGTAARERRHMFVDRHRDGRADGPVAGGCARAGVSIFGRFPAGGRRSLRGGADGVRVRARVLRRATG